MHTRSPTLRFFGAADFGDGAARLVAEHHRFVDYETADLAVQVIMDVAAADPDIGNLDTHIVGAQFLGQRGVTQGQAILFVEKQGFHFS